tara:strand:+ start:423 stop:1016 length:594 start_codon:yes stop_codon:yes gene_type:complete
MQNIELDLSKFDKYYITPNFYDGIYDDYFTKIEKLLKSGIKLVQFRSKNLPIDEYASVSNIIYKLCKKHNAFYIINDYINLENNCFCDGIQLTSENLKNCDLKLISNKFMLIGSCHNLNEIEICNLNKFDFILISPVKNSNKKIGIGWEKFNNLAKKSKIPVFALGGLNYDKDIENVKKNGGIGVAASSYYYNLFDS